MAVTWCGCMVMVVAIAASLCARGETFEPSKLALLDFNATRGTWLFRSNDPLSANGTAFAFSELVAAMAVDASAANGPPFPGPEGLFILDLALLSEIVPDDHTSLGIERAFFAANPDQGALIDWQFFGALSNPMDFDPLERRALAAALPDDELDHLHSRVPLVYSWMHTDPPPVTVPDGRALVVLVHCEGGCDRTGELSGAYEIAYLGATNMTSVVAENNAICGRAEHAGNVHAIDWYCWYLNYIVPGYESLDCVLSS